MLRRRDWVMREYYHLFHECTKHSELKLSEKFLSPNENSQVTGFLSPKKIQNDKVVRGPPALKPNPDGQPSGDAP